MRQALALDPELPGSGGAPVGRGEEARGGPAGAAPGPAAPRPASAPCSPAPPPGLPEDEARRALAELALIAPDDPRLGTAPAAETAGPRPQTRVEAGSVRRARSRWSDHGERLAPAPPPRASAASDAGGATRSTESTRTVNISGGGVCFESHRHLSVGAALTCSPSSCPRPCASDSATAPSTAPGPSSAGSSASRASTSRGSARASWAKPRRPALTLGLPRPVL